MTHTTTQADAVATLTSEALAASARRDAESAIALLGRAIELDHGAAVPRYLLGAEYAQIGLADKAIEAFDAALARDPGLHTARLQLGMLHLGAGRVEAALEAWSALSRLSGDDPVRLFAQGLASLVADRFDECRASLEAGIAANTRNEALNHDMRKVLAALDGNAPSAPAQGEHVLLGAYRGT